MRLAIGTSALVSATIVRTAPAMSRLEPASVPFSSWHTPSVTVMVRPFNSNEPALIPTLGMASVTSISRSVPFMRSAISSAGPATCTPSAMMPHHTASLSSAAPTMPGARCCSGDIAL